MRKWMLGIGLFISAITIAQPTITQVSPNSASSGSTITINGTNLTGVSAISLGGTAVASFQVLSSTTVTAVVAIGSTGAVSLTTSGGTISFSGFTFLPTIPAINSMSLITCSGVSFEISPINGINGVVPAGTTYSWNVPLLTAAMAGAESKSVQTSIYGTLTNSTNVTQTAVYSVTPFKSGAGAGQPFTVTITILASANINPTGMITCSGVSFSITPINIINGQVPLNTLYTWDVPTITAAQITGGLSTVNSMNINGTLFNNTPLAQTATYTVTPNTSGCIGKNFTVTISLLPTATIQNFTRLTTSGNAFTVGPMNLINGTIPTGTLYSWNAPTYTGLVTGGQTGMDSPNITGTLNNGTGSIQTATYLVSPRSGNCIGSVFSVVVTVQSSVSSPTITSFVPTSAGAGSSITITGTNFTGVSAVTLGGTAVSSFQVLSSTTILAVVGSGSTGALSIATSGGTVSLAGFTYLNTSLSVTSMTAVICSGVAFQISPIDGVNGIIPPGTTYSWGSPQVTTQILGGQTQTGKAFIYGTLVNTSFTIQTATYTVVPYEASSGLGAAFTVTITVLPAAQIAAFSRVVCSGVGFTITPVNLINGTIPSGTLYSWGVPITSTPSFTGNVSGSNQVAIFGTLQNKTNTLQSATYFVTPITILGLCAGAPFTVTIYVNPTADISPITLGICTGLTFSITPENNVNGIIPSGTTYSWSLPTYNVAVSGGQANSAMNNITGNLSNTSNTIQQAIYQVIPTSTLCGNGAAFSVVVNLSPRPIIAGISTSTCSGVGFMVTPTNGIHGTVPDGTLYSWSLPAFTGTITGSESRTDNPSIITGLLLNRTNTTQTVTYIVTPRFGDCVGNEFTVVVTVYPTSEINAMSTVTCSGTSFSVSVTNLIHGIVPNGTQYSWSFPTFSGTVTGGISGNNYPNGIIGLLLNRTNLLQTATYVVTPNSGSCLGAPFTFTVWINPTPEIVSFTNATCSGVGFSITPTNGIQGIIPVATLYTWALPQLSSASLTGGQTGFNKTNIVGTFINNSNTTQTATYSIIPSTPNCGSSYPFTLVVSVYPTPQINPFSVTVCSGVTFTLSPSNFTNNIAPAATRYTWNLPTYTGSITGGDSQTDVTAITGTLLNSSAVTQTATYFFSPRSGSCIGALFTVTVSINPTPEVSSFSITGCRRISFTAVPNNGLIPSNTLYSWAVPTYTASIVGGFSGTNRPYVVDTLANESNLPQEAYYSLTPKAGNCVGANFTLTLYIKPLPVINAISMLTCSGVPFVVSPTNGTDGLVPLGIIYKWDIPTFTGTITGGQNNNGPNFISGTLRNTTNTIQTATYIVSPYLPPCPWGASFTVTITLLPTAEINSITTVSCSGVPFVITPTNETNGIVPDGTLYSWSAPTFTGTVTGGASATNYPTNVTGNLLNRTNLAQTVTYVVIPQVGNCVGAAFSVIVSLQPTPEIANISQTTSSGAPFAISPANVLQGIIPFNTRYSWYLPTYSSASVTGALSASNQANIFGTLTNATNSIQTATYTINPIAGNCSGANFIVSVSLLPTINAPTITSFSPSSAGTGATITITGTNLNSTSAITLGGLSVATFQVLSSTTIAAVVGAGASGAVSITTAGGSAALSGFTYIYPTPTIVSFAPTSGPVGTLVTITGTNLNNPTAISIGGVAAIPISFSGNAVVAMVMPGATSGGVSVATLGGISNASGNFTVTTAKIPNSQQGVKLVGTGGIAYSNQGNSVAVSADGNTAIIGGFNDNSGPGAVWIYIRSGETWTQQGNKLVGLGSIGNGFQGYGVALSADGNTAIVGGMGDNGMVGAAWLWTRTNGVWSQQGSKLVGTGSTGSSRQGTSVAISADGNTAIVGGAGDNSSVGAAWVWTRSGGTWTQMGSKLVGSGSVGAANQGNSVAISADGKTVIIGGTADNSGVGAAWIWTRSGSTWTEQGSKLVGSGATGNANQGGRVALSANGNTAIVGGSTDNSNIGAAWVWTRSGTTWTQQGTKLVGANTIANTRQGFGLSLSADGNTAIIGGYGDNSGFGASWIWSRSGETWSQQGNKLVGTNAVGSPRQGYNVALSSDGTTAIVGGYYDNSNIGATWIFTAAPQPTITNFSPTIATTGTLINISGTNFTGTSAITLGGTTVASFTVVSSTSITAIVGSGTSGALSLVTLGGTATLGGFSFIAPPPTITNFNPTSAGAGSMITIIGTNLTGTSAITLGGTSVASFTVVSSTTITAIVGNGATGALSLVTPGGSATLEGFTYINQIPSINPINLTICSGVNFSISPVNGINGFIPTNTTYNWDLPSYSATITGGQSRFGQTSINGTLINQTTEVQTATYIVTPFSINGEGNPFTVTITILPSAVINTITSVTCSGIAVWVTPTNEINGIVPINTIYSWESPSYSSASVSGGISGTSQTNITGSLLINQTNSTQTATYIVVPQTGTCVGATFSFVVTINPTPKINIQTIVSCSGVLMQLTPLPGGNGILPSNTLFSWDVPVLSSISVTGGVSRSSQTKFSYQLTNSTNTIQSATYTIIPHTTNGCTGNSFTITVNLQLKPLIAPISTAICSGLTFIVNPTDGVNGIVPVGTQYRWSMPSTTGTITGGQSISGMSSVFGILYNYTNSTQTVTYQVTPSTSFCGNGTSFSVVVSLYTSPVIATMYSVINSGISFGVTPTDVTNGIIPNNTRYSWTLPSYTGSISGGQSAVKQLSITGLLLHQSASSQTATYSITPISTQGCIGMPFSLAITVQPNLTAPIISSFTPSSAGTGATITITGTNLNNTSAISLGGISVASFQVLSSTTISAVVGSGATGALSLINPNGTATLPGFVYISNAPSINSLSTASCSGASFTLSPVNGINGNIPDGTTYSWSAPTLAAGLSGGVSLSNQIIILGTLFNTTSSVQTAVYTIVPSHPTFGIGAPFTVTIKVNPELVITPLSISGCGKMIFKTIPFTNTNGPVLDSSLHIWTTPNQTVSFITRVRPENNFYSVDSVNWTNEFNFTKRFYYTPNPSGSCFGANYKLDVYLNPIPSINAITLTNCGGLPFVLSPTNVINGIVPDSISFSWNVPLLSGSLTGGNSGTNLTSINGQLFNLSNVTQTATYLITPISTNGNCVGAAFTLTVSVNPSPAISPINITTSSGIPFAISPTNGLQGIVPFNTRYSWNLPTYSSASVTGAQSAINQANIFGTLTNATNSIQTATYTISPIAGNCTGANFIVSVSLLPTINVPTITSFSPSSAGTGATITILGTNLENTVAISLGGISVASFQVLSSTTISAVVGAGASGAVSITTAGGSAALSGFTYIYPTPTILSFAPTSGPVGTLVTITGTNLNKPTAISIGGVAAIPISFSGSTLVAMVMPGATSGSVSVSTSGGTANGTGNFTILPSLAPYTQQGGKLVGTGAVGNALQGSSVAVSADGNTAIIGGFFDDRARGAAWIFTRIGNNWTQQGNKLGGTGAYQGMSVALSADGNTAIIGGDGDDQGIGAAWVYTRSGSTWTQQGEKLVGTGAVGNAYQGKSVALSADGNTAIIGGSADDGGNGAAWLFTRSGSTWTQQGNKLVGSGSVGKPLQGYSVAMSADGNTAIIGGYMDNVSKGAAWIFTRNGNIWSQQGSKLTGTGLTQYSQQGWSVALNADGNTAIVGGNTDDGARGAAWIFTRSGSSWTQQGNKLVGTGAVGGAAQGNSVAVSADGNTVIIGGYLDNGALGAAWVFTRNGSSWTQKGNKLVGTGSVGEVRQGASVAVSADGNTAIIGGNYDNGNAGAAWIFTPAPQPTITSFSPTAAAKGAIITINGTNLMGTSAITLGGSSVASFTIVSSTTINAVVGNGATGALSLVTPGGSASLPGFIFLTAAPSINSLSTATCSGASFSLSPVNGINGNIPDGTTYSWSAPTLAAGLSGGVSLTNQTFISGTLNNTTSSVQTAVYTIVPSHPTFGIGAPFTVTIKVNPELVITPLSITGCGKMIFKTIPFTNTNGPVLDSSLHIWTTPNETVSFKTRVRPENNFYSVDSVNWTNEFNFTKRFYYTPNPSGSCFGANYKLDVYLNPIPSINAITFTNCSGLPFVLAPTDGINGIVPDSISYSWNVPILSGSLTGGNSGANLTSINGQLFNPSNVTQTATYLITPISTNGNCVGAAFTLTVSVNPSPAISTINITTNSGIPFAITPTNGLQGIVLANTRYSWSLPKLTSTSIVGAQNATGQPNIFGSLTNNTANFQTATYSVTPQTGTCIGNAFTVSVTINPNIFITSFAPASAGTGAIITIRGKGLTNLNQISFGGTAASSFTKVSDTTATAIVGAGSSGFVKITSAYATDSLAGFTYGLPIIRLYRADSTLVFGAEKGKYSRALNYSVSANFLQNPLQIVAPDNFQVSRFQDSAYSSSLSINHQNGTIDSTKIFVRFKLDTLGSFTGSLVHTSLAATTRSITVTGSSQCDSVVYITPIINNILADTIICFKDSLVLSTTSGTFNNYLWSTGDTTKNLVVKSSGSYSLQVGSGKGCLSNVSRIIKTNKNTNPIPSLALIGNKTLISSIAPKYRWLVNNTLIPGNNTNSLVPSKIGFYAVETTNDSICWDRSTDYPIFVLSNPLINDTLAIKLYPNPTSTGTFFVVATLQRSTNVVARVTVADGNGNVLLQTNKFIFFGREVKIPITLAVKGTVFVRIDVNGDVKTQTVILQ